MSDSDLLLALSRMLDFKLAANLRPIENRLDRLENRMDVLENSVKRIDVQIENEIVPRLQNIEACYTDTYQRYQDYADRMEAAFEDIELLKKVVSEHSEKLQKIG